MVGKKRVLFREVNDRIREISVEFGEGPSYDLICECSEVGCVRRVVVPRNVYDALRHDVSHFFVSPEHVRSDDERVVTADRAFLVVAPATG